MTVYEGSPSLEDNWTQIGDYMFCRHEGILFAEPKESWEFDEEDNYWFNHISATYEYSPVDFFPDLIDALNCFKKEGLHIKLSGEDFKKLVEGSGVSMYSGSCRAMEDDEFDCGDLSCDNCKYSFVESVWVPFNRYDFIKDYGAFRRLVLIRDDYKCLCCGNDNEKDLQVHHIRAFKDNLELATSVKNGATLCKDCHTKYHKKYGWKGKQKTFSKFIKEMLD